MGRWWVSGRNWIYTVYWLECKLCSLSVLQHLFFCFPKLSAVDSLLDPDNRLHLTTDEQLKALLDKLDVVTSMRTSGGRTKRIRLLRREINALRQKLNQQQQSSQTVNGNNENEVKEEQEAVEQQEEEKKKKETAKDVGNGPLTTVSNSGTGILISYIYSYFNKI